jgi:hypothetical protein
MALPALRCHYYRGIPRGFVLPRFLKILPKIIEIDFLNFYIPLLSNGNQSPDSSTQSS